MSAQKATPKRVCFHGPPDGLEALVPAAAELPTTARLELPKLELTGEASCADAGCGLWWVHAQLPRQTSAGTHVGRLHLGEAEPLTVEVVVHPHHEVTLSPTQLIAQAAAGEQTHHQFVVINQGNATLVLPRDGAVGLLRDGGLEDALSLAYRGKADGLERVGVVADALAERHALAVVRIEGGPLTVEPQTYQRFEATLRWPSKLEPGYTYKGTWQLAHHVLPVSISALEPDSDGSSKPQAKPKAKPKGS